MWCGFAGRTRASSGERKCEEVNPLLAGLQHRTEASQPPVLNARYHVDLDYGMSADAIKSRIRKHGVNQKRAAARQANLCSRAIRLVVF